MKQEALVNRVKNIIPNENNTFSAKDVGLTAKQVHEARVRDFTAAPRPSFFVRSPGARRRRGGGHG